MLHILDDADDLTPDRLALKGEARLDVFADRVFVREMAFGETLVDDQDSRGLRVVAFGESASGEQWNFHNVEIIEADRTEVRTGPLAFRNITPFDIEGDDERVAAQRLWNDGAHRLDAGQRLHALQQCPVKRRGLLRLRITRVGQFDRRREYVVGVEPQIHLLQSAESLEQ